MQSFLGFAEQESVLLVISGIGQPWMAGAECKVNTMEKLSAKCSPMLFKCMASISVKVDPHSPNVLLFLFKENRVFCFIQWQRLLDICHQWVTSEEIKWVYVYSLWEMYLHYGRQRGLDESPRSCLVRPWEKGILLRVQRLFSSFFCPITWLWGFNSASRDKGTADALVRKPKGYLKCRRQSSAPTGYSSHSC